MSEWNLARNLKPGDVWVYSTPPKSVLVTGYDSSCGVHTLLYPGGVVKRRCFDMNEWVFVVSRRP